MQRAAVVFGAVVAASATVGVLAVSGGAQDPAGQTINLVTKNFEQKVIDAPPVERNPESIGRGDRFVLEADVVDAAGTRRGNFDVVCAATKGGGTKGRIVCDGAYSLKEGALYVMTVFRNKGDGDVSGAIVGGTRAYAGARGTWRTVDRPGERGGDPSDDTITLLP
jgi:hypothetical protein